MTKPEPSSDPNLKHIDKPGLTIVGPRPPSQTGETIPVPQGMEGLLKLACMNPEWRDKVLADPLGSARHARIALSPTEQKILKSIPNKTLATMIGSFVKTGWTSLRKPAMAAGAAAAALLASDMAEGAAPVSRGIRPDDPAPPSVDATAAAIDWMPLDKALVQANSNQCALMVVFPFANEAITAMPTKGLGLDLPTSGFLANLGSGNGQAVSAALKDARLLAVKVHRSSPESYRKSLDQFNVGRQAPIVLFLAPDQSILHKAQPRNEADLCGDIKTVPALLQTWLTQRKKP